MSSSYLLRSRSMTEAQRSLAERTLELLAMRAAAVQAGNQPNIDYCDRELEAIRRRSAILAGAEYGI